MTWVILVLASGALCTRGLAPAGIEPSRALQAPGHKLINNLVEHLTNIAGKATRHLGPLCSQCWALVSAVDLDNVANDITAGRQGQVKYERMSLTTKLIDPWLRNCWVNHHCVDEVNVVGSDVADKGLLELDINGHATGRTTGGQNLP